MARPYTPAYESEQQTVPYPMRYVTKSAASVGLEFRKGDVRRNVGSRRNRDLHHGHPRCLLPGAARFASMATCGAKLPFASWKTYIGFGGQKRTFAGAQI